MSWEPSRRLPPAPPDRFVRDPFPWEWRSPPPPQQYAPTPPRRAMSCAGCGAPPEPGRCSWCLRLSDDGGIGRPGGVLRYDIQRDDFGRIAGVLTTAGVMTANELRRLQGFSPLDVVEVTTITGTEPLYVARAWEDEPWYRPPQPDPTSK